MHKSIATICVFLMVLGSSALVCAQPTTIDHVVAGVNGYAITDSQLSELVRIFKMFQGRTVPFSSENELQRMVLRKSIDDYLLGEIAEEQNINVSESEVDTAIDSLRGDLTLEQFRQQLENKQIDLPTLRQKLLQEIVGEKVIRWKATQLQEMVTVNDAQVDEFLAQMHGLLSGEEPPNENVLAFVSRNHEAINQQAWVHLRQVLVEEAETASVVVQSLSEGTDFSLLAEEYSLGPRAKSGGDLGRIGLLDLPPDLRATVASLEKGAASAPSETSNGMYRLIKVEAKDMLSLNDWRNPVRTYLQNQRLIGLLDQWITGLRDEAYILINDERLKL